LFCAASIPEVDFDVALSLISQFAENTLDLLTFRRAFLESFSGFFQIGNGISEALLFSFAFVGISSAASPNPKASWIGVAQWIV